MINYKDRIKRGDLDGKVIFWDIDGTLAPYRFNGHVLDPYGSTNGQSEDEIQAHIFLYRKPSVFMQRVLGDIKAEQHIIMGHCSNEIEVADKYLWTDKYFPAIKTRLFEPCDVSKADAIINHCLNAKIDMNNIIFVDDVIRFIQEAELKGIESWHISSFMDYFEEN